jgi:hypothetical protein
MQAAMLENPTRSIRHPGHPVDAASIKDNTLFAKHAPRNTRATLTPPGTTHHHQFGRLPDWKADLIRHTTTHKEHLPLLASSSQVVVADGGMEGGKGCFGVVIAAGPIIIARARGVA